MGTPAFDVNLISALTPATSIAVSTGNPSDGQLKTNSAQLKNYISQFLTCTVADVNGLTGTYNNGTAGVGATFTITNITLPWIVNGYTTVLNDKIGLVNQVDLTQNGLWDLTTLESGNIVLTRSSNFDNSPTGLILYGTAIMPFNGTTIDYPQNGLSLYILTPSGVGAITPIVLGTTELFFLEVSPSGATTYNNILNYIGDGPSIGDQTNAQFFVTSILPDQTGKAGLVLSTDATNTLWQAGISTPSISGTPTSIDIVGGSSTGGNGNGADVTITGGLGDGSGVDGVINLQSLVNLSNGLDASATKLTNLLNGSNPQDAVTFSQLNNILSGITYYLNSPNGSLYVGLTSAQSGNNTTSGFSNFAFGANCLIGLTNGSGNIAIGANVMPGVSTGGSNVGVGGAVLQQATTAEDNTGMGRDALRNNNGNANTAIGSQCADTRASYTNCSFYGALADATVSGLTNSGAFGYNTQITISNAINIGNVCNLGINQPSPAQSLHVTQGSTTNVNAIQVDYSTNAPATPTAGFDLYGNSSHQVFVLTANGTATQINKLNTKQSTLTPSITAAALNAADVVLVASSTAPLRISDIQLYSAAGVVGIGITLSIIGASSGNVYATFPVSALAAGVINRMGVGGVAGANWQATVTTENVSLHTSGVLTSGTLSADVETVS